MATAAEVASLRRAAAIDPEDEVYTDSLLGAMFDDIGLQSAAAAIWREKASVAAGLVDTTESGSTRRLSQLHDQALAMGKAWEPVPEAEDAGTSSFTVGIERV
jgi:hypothetical protein